MLKIVNVHLSSAKIGKKFFKILKLWKTICIMRLLKFFTPASIPREKKDNFSPEAAYYVFVQSVT